MILCILHDFGMHLAHSCPMVFHAIHLLLSLQGVLLLRHQGTIFFVFIVFYLRTL